VPVDPLHRRFVPSGQTFARVLARVLRAYFPYARAAAVHQQRVSDLWGMDAALYKAAVAALPPYWFAGRRSAMRDVNQRWRRLRAGRALAPSGHVRKMTFDPDAFPVTPAPSVVGSFDVVDPGIPEAVKRLALDLAGEVTEATKDLIRASLREGIERGESGAEIAERLGPAFGPRRAATIARTEASRVFHDAHTATWKSYGLTHHRWEASSDACQNCLFLAGDTVRIGEPFIVLQTGRVAYRVVLHPPLHPRCACAVVPAEGDG
jgi:hypothetical protein